MLSLAELMDILPQRGQVAWIGIRPAKHADMQVLDDVRAEAGLGLTGDRYAKQDGKRQVTLIQAEHLSALASMLGRDELPPQILRRNLVVRGINLLALKDKQFRIGEAVMAFTGLCHPCSRMETALGPGGYNAMRGHGGINARVVQSGQIQHGSPVSAIPTTP